MPTGANDPRLASRPRRRIAHQVRIEEPNCWLCGQPIDLALDRQRHPMASVLDEVVPRKDGGSPLDRSNVRHAHRLCNGIRGVKPVTPALLAAIHHELARRARPTHSRTW